MTSGKKKKQMMKGMKGMNLDNIDMSNFNDLM